MKNKITDNKIIIYICAFLLPFIMSQIFFALCDIYPYGKGSILVSDMDLEFVNFYTYFVNLFKSKNDFSYMFAKTLGGDYPGLAAFQLHDPLLFVLFLFPGDKIVAGIQLMFSLQISIAGLSASVLLNNRYRKSRTSLLFSTAYSFCSFFFGNLVLTIYFGCLAILPLVIYFFLRSLDEKKALIPYTLLTVLYIFINFHMGFMLVIFLTLVFVSRIIADPKYITRLWQFVSSGVIILLIDGFFLIRTGLSLIGEKTTKGADYGIYRRFPMNQLFANFFSGSSRNGLMPLIYCSVAVLFFTIIYFISGKFSIREKLANAFLLVSIFVSMWINLIDAVWHGFNNPEGFYWRYAFFISFIMVVLAYKGFLALFMEENREKKGKIRVAAVFAILIAYLAWMVISRNVYIDRERLLVNVILIAGVFGICLICLSSEKAVRTGFLLLLILSVGDMLYNSEVIFTKNYSKDGEFPEMSGFKEEYNSIDSAVKYIKEHDTGFYRIEKDFDRAVNDPAMFDYAGLSHDSSCEKDEIIDWLKNFGFCRVVYYTYYNGGNTSFVDSLFGVGHFISRFDGIDKPYQHTDYSGKYHVYDNEYALPLIFEAPDGLAEYTFNEENIFEKQNDIAAYWNTGNDIYKKAVCEVSVEGVSEEEPGHYIRTGDDGYVVYRVSVTGDDPLYYYFSGPEMQGGDLYIDGEYTVPYFTETNHRVMCAGKHKTGEEIEFKLKLTGDELYVKEPCFYYEDEDAFKKWAETAQDHTQQIGAVNEISSSHLRFDTDLSENGNVIMTFPYDTAWKIKCDGKPIEPARGMGVLMSLDLPAGKHSIEMKYIPHGTAAGLIVSIIGILLFIFELKSIKKTSHTALQ